jgi:hypothetical protein
MGKTPSLTPAALLWAIEEYKTTTRPLADCLDDVGSTTAQLHDLAVQHQEVTAAMESARVARTELYDREQDKIAESVPSPDEAPYLYQTDREGHQVLTNAAIRLLELRHKHYAARAAYCETGTRIQRQQIESRNLHMHMDARANNIPAKESEPLHHLSLDALLGDLRDLSQPKKQD